MSVQMASLTASHFHETPAIRQAYKATIELRFDDAHSILDQIKIEDPENMLVILIEDYIDFFTVFINEDKKEFDKLKKNKKARIKQIKKYGDKSSPYYLFSQAEIELHWAVARAKFEEFLTASGEAYNAYKLLNKNVKLHPDFIANKKSLSAIHALAETIPGLFRFVFGIDGSIEQGTREITEVIKYTEENDFLFREEAAAIYAYILYFQNNKKEEAWQYLEHAGLDPTSSSLVNFLMASFALKVGENEKALDILLTRPMDGGRLPFYYLDFLEGRARLYKLDPKAKVYLEKFLDNFKGRHYIKEAYQKLAWYELLISEDIAAYKYYMARCQDQGHDLVDEDKQALKEAKDKTIPIPDLLRARLLYDGGYYEQAYNLLARKSYVLESHESTELEYFYRLGRVTHALGNYVDALSYYDSTIDKGENDKSHYACNAALQCGLIYESQSKKGQAKKYFKKCLAMSPKEYKNSIHQKAKSGLERIGED